MSRILEKVERRLGEKLLLKGDRCIGPKCVTVRRAYAPGVHGKKRRRGLSEYGQLLQTKQIIRYLYGLDDKDVEKYSKKAVSGTGIFNSNFIRFLESRLDNTVFRLGFANSRRIARQMVNHGHIQVNSRRVTAPSYAVKKGDAVAVKESSLASPIFAELDAKLKKYEEPKWLSLDKSKKIGTVSRAPEIEDAQLTVDVTKVKEYYSR